MSRRASALRLVDTDTGEVVQACPDCRTKDDEVAGLQRDIRGWAARFQQLKRDKEADAKQHPTWPVAVKLFDEWRRATRHLSCKWTADRFFLVEPFIREYGEAMVRRAIAGAAYDPFITTRRNGSKKRHDGWELILRDAGKFEEFANRAPKDRP